MTNRLSIVRRELAERRLDAGLFSHLPHIRWACGFTGSSALLTVTPADAFLVTDGRYAEQAEAETSEVTVLVAADGLLKRAAAEKAFETVSRAAYQSEHLSAAHATEVEESFPSVLWQGMSELLVERVAVKDAAAIRALQTSQTLTDQVFTEILPLIRPGVRERELAAEITYRHLRAGATEMAFPPIVATGANGARPHATPGEAKLKRGDLVTLDFGGVVDGYVADLTRTVAVGKPAAEQRQAYQAVLHAQEAALTEARAGITGRDLDAAARQSLTKAGYGDYFTHSLGHGIGLEVHEWPRLSRKNPKPLPKGAAMTIEPGIYVPGKFGVRIEDAIVLRSDGYDRLGTTSRELLIC